MESPSCTDLLIRPDFGLFFLVFFQFTKRKLDFHDPNPRSSYCAITQHGLVKKHTDRRD